MSRQYRILMFAPAFAPFANPEAIVNSKLALAFISAGWHVDIISRNFAEEWKGYNYGSEWVEPSLPLKSHTLIVSYKSKSKFAQLIDTAWSGIRMQYPIIGCRWAAHAFDLALDLHKEKPYNIIISRSLPDSAHLPALAFSKRTGVSWIANWNDASGDKNPPPAGKGSEASLGFFHDGFLAEVAQKASWLTFPSERMRRYICQYLKNGSEEKSTALPHIALEPPYDSKHRKPKEEFTICYAGYLYSGRNPDVFFRGVVEFIKSKRCRSKFRLIIVGLEDIGLNKVIKQYGLESNVQVTGPMGYMATLKVCRASDILLVIEAPYTEGIYLPSKFVDYVQTGRPILAVSPKNGTMNDILSTHGGGIAVDCTSAEEIARALRELYEHWESSTLDAAYASDKLYKLFAPDTILDIYKYIFERIGVKAL